MNLIDLKLTEKDFKILQEALEEIIWAKVYREKISDALLKQMFSSLIEKEEKENKEELKINFEKTMREQQEEKKKEINLLEETTKEISTKISLLFELMKLENLLNKENETKE